MPVRKMDIVSLLGGMNDTDVPDAIADNEWCLLKNMLTHRQRIVRRPGVSRVTTSPLSYPITGLASYKSATGAWTTIAGHESGIAKVVNNGFTELTQVMLTGSVPVGSDPWSIVQYQGTLLAARKGIGRMKASTDLITLHDAGIDAPASAPTAAAAAGGSMTAGAYKVIVTFYSIENAQESDGSPASGSVSLSGGNLKISLTNIPTSTDPRVNARRFYLTWPDRESYFRAAGFDLNDNTTTSLVLDVPTTALGDELSGKDGIPPTSFHSIAIWNERCWGHDGSNLYCSQPFKPQSFSVQDLFPVEPDSGHEIRALLAMPLRLVIGTTRATAIMTGISRAEFKLDVISDVHGCPAPQSMRQAGGLAIWWDGHHFVALRGNEVVRISDKKVRELTRNVKASERHLVAAEVWPDRNLYVAWLPQGNGVNEIGIAFDYSAGTWHQLELAAPGPGATVMGNTFSADYEQRILLACPDEYNVLQFDETAKTDCGSSIVCDLHGKAYPLGDPGVLKGMGAVHLSCSSIAETVELSLVVDGESTARKGPVTVSLDQPRRWKRYTFAFLKRLFTSAQLRIRYTGLRDFELEGLSFEVHDMHRVPQAIRLNAPPV